MDRTQNELFTSEKLKEMQSWSLERKIAVSQTRIIEWYQKNDGKVYVAFSGGKDSTVLLDLVRRIYPDVPAVFIDTGLEFPEVRNFVKEVENVLWLKPEMTYREVIKTYGYPLISKEVSKKIRSARNQPDGYSAQCFIPDSPANAKYGNRYCLKKWTFLKDSDIPVSDMCCHVMKKKPAKNFEKKTGLKPFLGTMAEESLLRETEWKRSGCNSFNSPRPTSKPLSFWTEQDIFDYIVRFKIPYCDLYGKITQNDDGSFSTSGYTRTGCVFCGFGCHLEKEPNRFQKLKTTHPKLWDHCMRSWDNGGLGMKEPLEFIGVKTE